ncbi:MAG: L-threonylcarbamoyladenylate synthase [Patescibacteria group bacterium]|jgi:L-threonylcarbamoyladenylate synthase
MEVIKLTCGNVSRGAMARIGQVLAAGGVVVYPSDTVYGLGAIISCQKAVEKIKYIKGRYHDKSLSILVRDMAMANRYGYMTATVHRYLPGPYTVLVAKKPLVREWVSNNNLVGMRWPKFWFTEELMHNVIEPIITTSANLSGYPPAYSVYELLRQLGARAQMIDLIVDAGVLLRKPASTIIDLTSNKIMPR